MHHPDRRMHPAARRTWKPAGFSVRRLAGSIQRAGGFITRTAGCGLGRVWSVVIPLAAFLLPFPAAADRARLVETDREAAEARVELALGAR
jgi:hypothetical protein